MTVIRLAFPNIHLLTQSYTSDSARIESAGVDDVAAVASSVGLTDRSWRPTKGPQPRVGDARWHRGNLGGIACLVLRPEGALIHLMRRDGTPVAIVRRISEDRADRGAAG